MLLKLSVYTICAFITSAFDEITTETFDGSPQTIGWIKVLTCTEGSILDQFPNPTFWRSSDIQTLATSAISVKIVPEGSINNQYYDDYAVVAKPNSNVIQSLNDYKELSFQYDLTASPNRIGFANLENWIGTSQAKNRLVNSCGPDNVRSFSIAYHACGNGNGLHIINSGHCFWDWQSMLGENMEIYFGYYTPAPTANPTPVPTWLPTQGPIPAWHANYDEVTTEIFEANGVPRTIAWTKVLSCAEGNPSNNVWRSESIETLSASAISVKFVPVGSKSNPNYNDYAVIAKPNSNVIQALNDYKELSFQYEAPSTIFGAADTNNWIGSPQAIARLENSAPSAATSSLNIIYRAPGNGGGIHVYGNSVCKWEWNTVTGEDFEVYFGHDPPDPTTLLPITSVSFPFSSDKVALWSDFFVRGKSESTSGTGTLLNDYELEFVATKYDVVSIEKCLSNPWGSTESQFYNLAEGLKQKNPNLAVLFYWNVIIMYSDCYENDIISELSDPLLRDDEGRIVYTQNNANRPIYDLRQSEVRTWWVNYVVDIMNNAPAGTVIDGIFADGMCSWLTNYRYIDSNGNFQPSTFSLQTVKDYDQGIIDMMDELKAALPDKFILGNGLKSYMFTDPNDALYTGLNEDGHCTHVIEHIDGVCVEHYGSHEMLNPTTGMVNPDALKEVVQFSNWISNNRYGENKSIFVKAWIGPETNPNQNGPDCVDLCGNPKWKDTPEVQDAYGVTPRTYADLRTAAVEHLDYPLATYLCGIYNDRVYFSYGWYWELYGGYISDPSNPNNGAPEQWYAQFENALGEANGQGVFDSAGYVCTRTFEYATISVDYRDPNSAQISWITPPSAFINDEQTDDSAYSKHNKIISDNNSMSVFLTVIMIGGSVFIIVVICIIYCRMRKNGKKAMDNHVSNIDKETQNDKSIENKTAKLDIVITGTNNEPQTQSTNASNNTATTPNTSNHTPITDDSTNSIVIN